LILLILSKILKSAVLVEIQVECPHCGEVFTSTADTSQGDLHHDRDCQVCCGADEHRSDLRTGPVEEVRVTPA